MPIAKLYNEDLNLLIEVGTGEVTLEQLLAHRQSLLDLPMRSGVRCLADYSRAQVSLDYHQVCSLIEPTKAVIGDKDFKSAIFAPDDHGFGIARMYDMTHTDDHYKAMVFRTMAEACEWLDLPADEIQRIVDGMLPGE